MWNIYQGSPTKLELSTSSTTTKHTSCCKKRRDSKQHVNTRQELLYQEKRKSRRSYISEEHRRIRKIMETHTIELFSVQGCFEASDKDERVASKAVN